MKWFWNIIYYSVYNFDYKFHIFFNKVNPVYYVYKLPFAKSHFKKREISDPITEVNKAFKRPDTGLSSIRAGGFMYILFFLACLGFTNLFSGILRQSLNLKLSDFAILVAVSIIANHFLLFKQKKYLAYFKEFDTMNKKLKNQWAWKSFLVVLGILIFSIGSFFFVVYRH